MFSWYLRHIGCLPLRPEIASDPGHTVRSQVVRGCYTGVRPKFNATESPAVLRGLDFFRIPQELRLAGLVLQAQLQKKYTDTFQKATQLIEAAQTDIVRAMTPDDNGLAQVELLLCRNEGNELRLEVFDPPSEAQGLEEISLHVSLPSAT